MRKAVIDVGSNSVLLLLAERTDSGWQTVCDCSEVTALGEQVKQTGVLSSEAMHRTLKAVKQFWDRAISEGANEVLAFATMAARIASNSQEFIQQSVRQGTPIAILSGENEAELGFLAVAEDPTFAQERRISIIDPGGHSTELMTANRTENGWEKRFKRSFGVGTLGLRGGFLQAESPSGPAWLSASSHIDDVIGLTYLRNQAGKAVVLGAAGTNLVSVKLRLPTWEPERVHGFCLSFEEVSQAVAILGHKTDDERAQVEGLEPGRERTIHIGALILERFLFAIGVNEVTVSVRGWRHAVLDHPELTAD